MTRTYISGAMTGLPEMNYPEFNRVAAMLRARGMTVENPAENPLQETWAEYMRVAIRQLLTCDSVVLLPSWFESRGAQLEVRIASALGMTIYPLSHFEEI